jgi:pSer/pThr/pTyr-binding forkhead associated (FHA) protein
MKLIIEDDEGRKTVVPIVREEIDITIGRHEENTIRLTERNVSRRHAKLSRRATNVWVEDLGSYNGVRVNGDRIQGRIEVKEGDLIQIGDYDLAVQLDGAAARADTVQNIPAAAAPAPAAGHGPSGPHAQPAAATPAARANGADGAHTPASQVPKRIEPTSVIRLNELEQMKQRPVVDVPPDQAPKLVLISTPLAGREYSFIRSELSIGRTDDNDIAIDHRSLSRNHCKIFRDTDGSWKIIDLQSANGVKVNGEVYAQSSLKFGDVIELGHAKFQFLGPGEEPTTGHEKGKTATKKLSMKLIGILVGGAFAIGGGATFLIIRSRPKTLPLPDVEKPQTAPLPGKTTPTPSKASEGLSQEARESYAHAMKLLGEQKFEEAAKALRTAKEEGHPEAEGALARADAEAAAGKTLQDAQDKASKKDWEGARFAAEQIPMDSFFANEAKKVIEKIEKAEKAEKTASEKTEKPPEKVEKEKPEKVEKTEKKTAPTHTTSKKTEKAGGKEEAQANVDKAMGLLRQQQPKEAAHFFELALKADPALLKLHKALGSCYAQIGENGKSAEHYRKYIEAFPTASDTPAIRENLRMYDQEHKSNDE